MRQAFTKPELMCFIHNHSCNCWVTENAFWCDMIVTANLFPLWLGLRRIEFSDHATPFAFIPPCDQFASIKTYPGEQQCGADIFYKGRNLGQVNSIPVSGAEDK